MSKPIDKIETWMVTYLADLLEIPQAEVGLNVPLENFGLDSAAIVAFTSDLSDWIGIKLDSDTLFQCPDIKSAAEFIRDKAVARV